ncbi:valyl-tRNA synthetase [Anaeroplasma bactoclasticum]|jgi:valyl-tRNA synthetase|uniref:Valine--tRNA ligase n=1 Tax=Anaeroplasma bactoclasticum TaxID=2088 RepID=A0A397RMW3_9MOLU|nr:valine--tRNA ligase [Anaeroplasma bactoclasticum]RIA75670.1 valyl-tRNA synthetase [Anaeroplasma bactoclasticum]
MSKELKPKYDFKEVEAGKYDFWLKGGFFTAGDKSKEPFTIVIPPPNVTGKLHLGHSWDTTLQDIIIRRKRMQGYDALWLPGMDHAGIATQAKVDAKLKEQGISRYDLGREKFLEVAWQWKHEYAGFIRSQWAALGLSLDYTKERFTLDEGLNKAVNHVFITLYNKGLLYQGERIINWDCQAKTALSNIEVEHTDDEGAFYHYNYPLTDGSGYVTIATTRPETMFADQAVMVHPEDERYKNIIGKKVRIPLTNIEIPVIADSYVDKDFGTGCVKVTPAHDPNDFEVGKRHNLPMPLCMNDDGTMNSMAGKYEGMDRFECRKHIIEDLQKEGLYVKTEPIVHSVGHSERTGVVVEPRLSKQWFVKMDVLAKQVLENDEYRFVPQRFKQTLEHWLDPESIQDWCVSRQLWWGHRIPAWYKDNEVKVQVECPGEGWVQDEDVLDTWFSSALWPFSTLGWPEKTDLLERYYPTNVLVTGYDIIFFWVARMLFQGVEFTHHAPFKDILIHGLIRDSQGRKMSKSLGNGVDPFDVIAKYGTDSLRYFLTTNSAPGLDLRFDETKIESSWNYLNKIWNISRYVLMNLGTGYKETSIEVSKLNLPSKWILSKLNKVIENVDYNMEKYEFGEAARTLYSFVWDDFASWYVELSKVDLQSEDKEEQQMTKNVLVYVLRAIVKLLHPFIPFITEEIYQALPHKEASITISKWPTVKEEFKDELDKEAIDDMIEIITAVRNERSKANKAPKEPIALTIVAKDNAVSKTIASTTKYLFKFTNPKKLEFLTSDEGLDSKRYVIVVLPMCKIFIPTEDLVNLEEAIKKLEATKAKLEAELARSEKMLSNESFISKAPQAKIDAEKAKQKEYKEQYEEVLKSLANLNA